MDLRLHYAQLGKGQASGRVGSPSKTGGEGRPRGSESHVVAARGMKWWTLRVQASVFSRPERQEKAWDLFRLLAVYQAEQALSAPLTD
jgi:hypothetical protein